MNEKEEKKYITIEKLVNGLITKDEASDILNLSKKQINRLIIRYKEEGKEGFIHKNHGNNNSNKTDENIKQEIINLYLNEYNDYNFTHFYVDRISKEYDISFVNMVNILTNEEIISPLAQHKTVNEYNKKMREEIKNNTITEEKKELFETRQISEEQAHTRKSTLFYIFGEELQMDASEYIWFGDIVTQLHLVIDKATKLVLFGWFDYEETTRAYFILLFNTIYLYGIPKKIRTDCRKVFDSNNGEKTQFGRICKELNIELQSSSNPRFKPNVERENKTFKGRLKSELRHENITTIEEANTYLNDVFIPKINKQFAHKIEQGKTLMRQNKYTLEELTLIISERYERIIDSGACIKYNNKYYIPVNDKEEKVYFKQKTPAIIIIDYNHELRCLIEQEYYNLKEIKIKEKYILSQVAEEIKEEMKKEKKPWIPPSNHPWRNYKNKS